MGKIIVSENVSLDGVIQDPTGEEGFRHGGWFGQIGDKDREDGPRWSSTRRWAPRPCCWAGGATSGSPRGGCPGAATWADRLNSLPKYVVSSTLEEPKWTNRRC